MSGAAGAIKGGMAYVAAYLDDNPAVRGLAKLKGKFQSWQASLSTMGSGAYGGQLPEPFAAIVRFATSPAGAFTALLGAAKYTANANEEMLRMSETTGVAVEKLSALSYAARRAGVSNEALAAGLKKLQSKEFQMLMAGGGHGAIGGAKGGAVGGGKGGGGKIDFAAALGIDKSKDAADQLRQITKQFEKLDTVSRIGLAKKLGISELLPLINEGIENLDHFTARAKELGLVMSEEDARAGKEFGLALGDLHDVVMSSVKAIGGALVPMITGLTNLIVPVAVGIRDWLKSHKALTIAIFAGTGAIVAGGIALKALSVVSGLAAAGVGALKMVFAVASGVVSFFNGVLTVTQALMGSAALPFLLVGAAIVGIIGYIGYISGAFSRLGQQWQDFSADTSESIGAIANAISKGDLEQAWAVVTAYFSTEWQRLINTLQEIWEGYRQYFTEAWYGMLSVWNKICSSIKTGWQNMLAGMKTMWADWKEGMGSKVTGFFEDKQEIEQLKRRQAAAIALREKAKTEHPEWGLDDISTQGPKTANEALHEDMNRERKDAVTTRDANVSAIDKERQAEEQRLGAAMNAAQKARDLRQKEREEKLQAARDALHAAQAAANVPGKKHPLGPKGDQAFAAAAAGEIRGTFSGAVAGMLGGGGALAVAQAQLDEQKNQSDIMRAQVAAAEKQYEETKKINATIVDINSIA